MRIMIDLRPILETVRLNRGKKKENGKVTASTGGEFRSKSADGAFMTNQRGKGVSGKRTRVLGTRRGKGIHLSGEKKGRLAPLKGGKSRLITFI